MKKKLLVWPFVSIIVLIIAYGVFYAISPHPVSEYAKIEERLKYLSKQISIYRSDASYAYYILEKLYKEKGNIYRLKGEYSEAYNCYREAIQFAKKDKNHRHVAELAWFMIQLATEQKQSALVLTLSKKYQKIIVQHDYYPFNFYYWWGMAYLAENNLEAAQKTLNKGLKYLNSKRDYNYSEQKLMIYCALSTIYARKQDFSKCEEYLNKTNKLFTEDCTLTKTEDSDNIYISNEAYLSLKSSLIEIEKNSPPRSVALGDAYRKLAECYSRSDSKKYRKNMLKAIKKYPPTSPQIAKVYFDLGEFFHKNQKYYFDKCVLALAGVKNNSAAKMLLDIASKIPYEYQDKSFHFYKLALKALPDSNKNPYVTTRIFCGFADYYSEKKDWQKAAVYAQKSFEYAKKIGKTELSFEFVFECYEYVDNFYEMQKDIKKRIKNAENAVALMRRKDDFYCLNKAYAMLGRIYKLAKRYSDAEKAYREITKAFAKNPKRREDFIDPMQEINAYCEIGNLCLLQKKQKRAEKAFDRVEKILSNKSSKFSEWDLHKNAIIIINGYIEMHKYSKAIKLQSWALAALKERKPSNFSMGRILLDFGINYSNMEKYENAKEHLLRALGKFQYNSKNYLYWRGITSFHIARNARYHNKWKEAENYYEKAVRLLEKYLASLKNNKHNLEQIEKNAFLGICLAYKWLQTCYHCNNVPNKSLQTYYKIKKIWKTNSIDLIQIYPSLIANYIDLKKYKQALLIIQEGILYLKSLPVSLEKQSLIATFCYLDAKIMFLSGDKEKAIKKCKNALALFKKINSSSSKVKLISKRLEEWKNETLAEQ